MQKLLIVILISILTVGCSLIDPLVYRLSIQQGNIVDQSQIDQLKYGMTKDQVSFVLGTPMVRDAFDADRWDYIYTLVNGRGKQFRKNLVVSFKGDKLTTVAGDFKTEKIGSVK